MLALALILPLLVSSTGNCYLVSNEGIDPIPCDFSAAATDALRYAAAARAEKERERRHEADPWRGSRSSPYGRGARVGARR